MKKFLWTMLVLVLVMAAIAGAGWVTFKNINHSYEGNAHIFAGATTKAIAQQLEYEGIVKDADYFFYYIKAKIWYEKNISKTFKEENYVFQSGDYRFEDGGDFDSVIALLVEGENDPQTVTVTFPEGISVEEMAEILHEAEIVDEKVFLAYVRNKDNYLQMKTKYPWLPTPPARMTEYFEGYLHTTTYLFDKKKPYQTDVRIVVDKMLAETNRWYERYADEVERSPYSFAELMTLASVVEKEAKFESDRPKVAQVFYNRLNSGMKLQSDMTAAYANGEHKVFMYNKDIAIKSHYNTYYTKALPLGPIASPSESSLLAVLHPEGKQFNHLFFYARPNGETYYAATVKQHQKNIDLYEKEWKALEKEEKEKEKTPAE